jgi:hypothetical protein
MIRCVDLKYSLLVIKSLQDANAATYYNSILGKPSDLSVALRRGRSTSAEVDLVVDIVFSVGISLDRRRVGRSTGLGRLGVQEVGRESVVRAAESSATDDRVEDAESPANTLGNLLLGAADGKRRDGVDALVDVAEKRLDAEVGCADLRSTRNDDVPRVDLEETICESLDGAVGSGAAVPVLGPPLGNVLEFASALLVLGSDDAEDGLRVGNTASTVSTVGEELRVEGESTQRHDLGEGEVVEVGVVVLGEASAFAVRASHDVHGELLVGILSGILDELLDKARRQLVVVTAAKVVVLTGRRDVSLDSGVPVETTDTVLACSQVERLCVDVTVRQHGEGGENCSKVRTHVETSGCGIQNLTEVDVAVARKVSICHSESVMPHIVIMLALTVGKQVQTGAGTTRVARTGRLEFVARLRTLVIRDD